MTGDVPAWSVVRPTVIRLTLLLLLSTCLTTICAALMLADTAPPPGVGVRATESFCWAFAFLPMAAEKLGRREFVIPLLVVNPLVYTGGWWVMWRMWVLMRPKPE